MWNKTSSFAYKLWILTSFVHNYFILVEGKVSLIFMYIYIVLVSVYLLIVLYLLQVCLLGFSHSFGNDVSSLAGKECCLLRHFFS